MALSSTLLNAQDTIFAGDASCYFTLDGQRYLFMQAKSIEATVEKSKKEIPIMGTPKVGHKSGSLKYKGKAKFYYNTSLFRKYLKKYQDTGTDFYFDMTCINNDPNSEAGEQTIVLKDCNFDDLTIFKAEAGGDEAQEEDASFTFESFEMPEEFSLLDGMKQ